MEDYINKEFDAAVTTAEYEITEAIREYALKFSRACAQNGEIPAIDQVEDMWEELDAKSKKIFACLISESINSYSERGNIASKKANTNRKE